MTKILKDSDFATILSENRVVMVDFSATWCGPCRLLSPVVDELAEQYSGKVFVGKCDVDENDAPLLYKVTNIPTLLFFKDGELVDRLVGSVPKNEIVAKLESIL